MVEVSSKRVEGDFFLVSNDVIFCFSLKFHSSFNGKNIVCNRDFSSLHYEWKPKESKETFQRKIFRNSGQMERDRWFKLTMRKHLTAIDSELLP